MRIAEIYESRQGEGLLTGTPSVFIRASGCNLRCSFCDTRFASWEPEGADTSVDDIVAQAESFSARHAVITGGEPMLFAELIPLCRKLREAGFHLTIETAGTLDLPVVCDLMSISPKRANSTPDESAGKWVERHERSRHRPEVVSRLMRDYDYQLKFVIDTPADLTDVEAYLAEFPDVRGERVLLMPLGTSMEELSARTPWVEAACQSRGWVYCPRKHVEWYGFQRGT